MQFVIKTAPVYMSKDKYLSWNEPIVDPLTVNGREQIPPEGSL